MSKKKFDPNDTSILSDELDQSQFFQSSLHPPLPGGKSQDSSVNPQLQKSANAEKQTAANAELQRAARRKTYDKTSYRLCPEAFDAIENAKRVLKRKFGIRASYEDIAEIALMLVNEDLETHGQESALVKRLSTILQMQK